MSVMARFVFLLMLVALSSADQLNRPRRNNRPLDCSRTVDVAIVGAGPSGAYSAYKLRKSNKVVELFEFSNRVGGRLYTTTLPNAPDLLLEAGGMRFISEVHVKVEAVTKELGLTKVPFSLHHGNNANAFYYLRGRTLTSAQVSGGDIPYNLNPEEKANQGRLFRYYLEKLTGYNGTEVTQDILMQLKLSDGRYMYQVPIDEALDTVATADGKAFLRALAIFESDGAADTSSLPIFENNLGPENGDFVVQTIKEGFSAIPTKLVDRFLKASKRHKLTINRRLVSIRNCREGYVLELVHTNTQNGYTFEKLNRDVVCARKVILAVPKFALKTIDWSPLRDKRVEDAINAVREVPANKVFMTFSRPWWLQNAPHATPVMFSDQAFSQAYDFGRSNITGVYTLMTSYSEDSKSSRLLSLNTKGELLSGSAPGPNRVMTPLAEHILTDLAKAYGMKRSEIPAPITSMSQFWVSYPFGCGFVIWKAGYRYDEVISTIQHPSLTDDVFVVGADHAKGYHVGWVEGAFASVDRVFSLYF
ncbi:achacin-like isoform X2 [Physella acuta]|nr:achacin-like isoform X2 [Physella acuta]XP_059140728.1 achacin-like isoform X2 [Physella acuta]XP_059140729.1 achacin-like isoform X2 [Physella acuta]XP_059140730.1 achacin-like isoform X2 [Physella acuta]